VTFTAAGGSNYDFRVNDTSIQNSGLAAYTTTKLKNRQLVDVIVTGISGCMVASAGIKNTVLALPVPIIVGPTQICAGVTGNEYITEPGMSDYSWTVSTGGTITAGGGTGDSTITIAWTTHGAKTVTVSYTNSTGCTATSPAKYNITVKALPVSTARNNGPVCSGNALNLIGGPAGMTAYSWTGPGGFTSLTQNPSVSANSIVAMSGKYTLTVTNASGCKDTAVTSVSVNALPAVTAGNNGPVCEGNALNLTGGPAGMSAYSWTGPGGFTSLVQNPSVPANSQWLWLVLCLLLPIPIDARMRHYDSVTVNASPLVNITSSSSSMCINDSRTLTGSPVGGTFNISDGPGVITGNFLLATGTGIINLTYTYFDVCANGATQSIIVNENPIAIPGPDQELKFVFETQMKAELSASETGEWSLISGTGQINDIQSPTTRVTELSIGENSFLWKVWKENCIGSAEIKITVYDPFIPSVITPNGDGKNDYFKIGEIVGQVELVIFNRWGNENIQMAII
jgi:hypothetical protein